MPLAVENLTKESSIVSIRDAIGATIKQLIGEGREQKQAAAIAYDIAREKTGKSLGEGRQR